MTEVELTPTSYQWIADLQKVTMLPGSSEKRFVRQIVNADKLTERQFDYLVKVRHRYRKQIGGECTCYECETDGLEYEDTL